MSRPTAGTTEKMPGDNELFFNTYQANRQLNQIGGQEPELLPVSCGYFFAIVRQLLLKQRKMVIKYVLLDTKGVLVTHAASHNYDNHRCWPRLQ